MAELAGMGEAVITAVVARRRVRTCMMCRWVVGGGKWCVCVVGLVESVGCVWF